MELHFERIQSGSHRHLASLLPLYLDAFPLEERRTGNELRSMLNVDEMNLSAVLQERTLVGLVVFWNFGSFLYLEHLAVLPMFRGKGHGEKVLALLKREALPILLEVEKPFDEVSSRRIAFYQRCGFQALPVCYHQPPYRKGDAVVPMMLFSNQEKWDPENLAAATSQFQSRVYFNGR